MKSLKTDGAKVLAPSSVDRWRTTPISSAFELGAQQVVAVVGHQADLVKSTLAAQFPGQPLQFALQVQQRRHR